MQARVQLNNKISIFFLGIGGTDFFSVQCTMYVHLYEDLATKANLQVHTDAILQST